MIRTLCAVIALTSFAPFAGAQDATSHFNKGVGLYHANKLEDALAEFQTAKQGAPGDPLIYNWIGFLDLRLSRSDEAIEPLEKATSLRTNYAEAWTNLGNAYLNVKRGQD